MTDPVYRSINRTLSSHVGTTPSTRKPWRNTEKLRSLYTIYHRPQVLPLTAASKAKKDQRDQPNKGNKKWVQLSAPMSTNGALYTQVFVKPAKQNRTDCFYNNSLKKALRRCGKNTKQFTSTIASLNNISTHIEQTSRFMAEQSQFSRLRF